MAKLNIKRRRKRATAGVQLPPKADCEPKRFVREFRGSAGDRQVGQTVTVDIFRPVLDELPTMLRELAGKTKVDTAKPGWEELLRSKKPYDYRAVVRSIATVDVTGISKGRGFSMGSPHPPTPGSCGTW